MRLIAIAALSLLAGCCSTPRVASRSIPLLETPTPFIRAEGTGALASGVIDLGRKDDPARGETSDAVIASTDGSNALTPGPFIVALREFTGEALTSRTDAAVYAEKDTVVMRHTACTVAAAKGLVQTLREMKDRMIHVESEFRLVTNPGLSAFDGFRSLAGGLGGVYDASKCEAWSQGPDQVDSRMGAPAITLLPAQRGSVSICTQRAYVRNYAFAADGLDPEIGVVCNGLSVGLCGVANGPGSTDVLLADLSFTGSFDPPALASIPVAAGNGARTALEIPLITERRLREVVVVPENGTLVLIVPHYAARSLVVTIEPRLMEVAPSAPSLH
ncbi:MAG: hypothetical protein HYY93_04200 [Planctomycetes bacterium]|nr:hypothetical protein [Planctomycetota bacterium]